MTDVLLRRSHSHGGRDESNVAGKPGAPRAVGSQKNLEEPKKDSSPERFKGAWPCRHLAFRLLASRTARE